MIARTYSVRKVCLLLGLIYFTTGCGFLMYGPQHHLGIMSDPSGAKITLDGHAIYSTPVTIVLEKTKNYSIKIEMEGYQPYELEITRKVIWGLAFVEIYMFPALIVDLATNSLYTMSPDEVTVQLTKKKISHMDRGDVFQIFIVEGVDPAAKKYATLTKIGD